MSGTPAHWPADTGHTDRTTLRRGSHCSSHPDNMFLVGLGVCGQTRAASLIFYLNVVFLPGVRPEEAGGDAVGDWEEAQTGV